MRSFSFAFLFYVFFSFGFTESSYANTCFTDADDARLQFDVFQNAPPSHMDSADWPYYPASGAASAQITALNTTAQQLKLFYWQWANHGTRAVAKGNLAPGVADVTKTIVNFSTIDKANACTLAQTAFALGKSNYGNGVAARHGLQVTSVVPTNPSMTDVCIVPGQMLSPNVGGILLDYEVQDGRTALQTKNFLIAWASMVHGAGRKAFLYSNPLDGQHKR